MQLGFFSKVLAFTFISLLTLPAFSAVTYQFDFTDLSNKNYTSAAVTSFDDFSVTLTYNDYVVTSEMEQILGNPLSTSLGWSAAFASTVGGNWALDDDQTGFFDATGFTFSGESLVMYFNSSVLNNAFQIGSYTGSVVGNAFVSNVDYTGLVGFDGSVVLSVSEVTSVPEASSIALLFLGLISVVALRRKHN